MTNNSGKSLYCLLLVAFLGILFIVNIGYGDPYYEEWPIDDPNDDTDTCVGCCKGCCGPCCGEDECDDCDPGPPPPPPPPGPPGPPPPPPPPPGPTGGDPVYIRNGEFRYYHTDFSIEGRALGLTLKRTYGSRRRYNSPFGYGWDINYNMKVRILDDPNTIVYVNGKGCTVEYDNNTSTDPNIYWNSEKTSSYMDYDVTSSTFSLIHTKSDRTYNFDTNGNLSSITDNFGNSITFTYDSNGLMPLEGSSEFFIEEEYGGPSGGRGIVAMNYRLIKITDDLGRDIDLTYNSDGLMETIEDFAGRQWNYVYDPNTNDLLAVTGPATTDYPNGHTIGYTYNSQRQLETVVDPNEQVVVENFYNEDYKVIKQTFGGGDFIFDYDDANSVTTTTDRSGVKKDMSYNDNGQLVQQTVYTLDPQDEPNSFTWQYVYDANNRKVLNIYPAGNCVYYTYNDAGNKTGVYQKTCVTDPNTASDPNVLATLYTYDPNFIGNVKTITDFLGNVTTYDYNDVTGKLESITYPSVTISGSSVTPVEYYSYNESGQVETKTSVDGIVNKYVYYSDANDANNFGRLWKMVHDANESDPNRLEITSEYAYDLLGNIAEVNDPNGDITQYSYNELGQTIQVQDRDGKITKYSYDNRGNQSKVEKQTDDVSNPWQVTEFTYNTQNKLILIEGPLGNLIEVGYNKNDDPNIVTDAEDNSTIKEYNERGLVSKIIDANDGETEYSYGLNGNLETITDAKDQVTEYDYDKFNRLICITYEDDSNEVFSYDKNANLISKKIRSDETIYFEYDELNRRIVVNRPGDPNIIFTYDIAGRVAEVNDLRLLADGGGITSCEYDRIGRVTEVNDIYSRVVSYSYDDLYQRTQVGYPMWSFVLDYDYDNMSRLKKVYSDAWEVVEYEYDSLSRRIKATYDNDVNCVYEYDIANRLESMTNNFASGSAITAYDSYDDVGNRLSMKVGDANTHAYNYDNLYQLTAVDYNDGNNTSYVYDELGNRKSIDDGTEVSYISNSLNQYSSVGGTGFTYDNNGNLSYDGTYRYYYDCQNRLIDVNDQSDDPVVFYAYDYKGKRVSKTVYDSPDVTTTYCYDGDQVIAEFNGSSTTLVRMFVYGANIDEPVYIYDAGGTPSQAYYHYDALGSVVALSDGSGNLAESYSYDVFGEPTIFDADSNEISLSGYDNPYMFTARRYDTETANYYYRARYYHPEIGRFIQTDPIGHGGGINLYAYCKNRPIVLIDPEGLKPWYGNYCGPGSSGAGSDDIHDKLDGACRDHDDCYDECWGPDGVCGVIAPSFCKRKCDRKLCRSAMFTWCGSDAKCWAARHVIMSFFCANGLRPF